MMAVMGTASTEKDKQLVQSTAQDTSAAQVQAATPTAASPSSGVQKDGVSGNVTAGVTLTLPDTTYTSPYDQKLKDLYDSIANQKPFTYNASEDELYQQYKDRYTQLGQQAMRDTMGQAAALTGGYGSSYGQAVGQQTYDQYMLGLNDKASEMYASAYDR